MLPCPSLLYIAKPSPIAYASLPNPQQKQNARSEELATNPQESIQKRDLNLGVLDFDFVQTNGKPSGIRDVNRNQQNVKSLFSPSYWELDRQAIHPTSRAYHECYTAQSWSTARMTPPRCCTGKERMLVGNSREMLKDILSCASQLLGPLYFTTHSLPYLLWKANFNLFKPCFMCSWFSYASLTLMMHFSHPFYLLYSSSFSFLPSQSFLFQLNCIQHTSVAQFPLSNLLHTWVSNSLVCARMLLSFPDHLSHILWGFCICEIVVPCMASLIKTLLSALVLELQLPLLQLYTRLPMSFSLPL